MHLDGSGRSGPFQQYSDAPGSLFRHMATDTILFDTCYHLVIDFTEMLMYRTMTTHTTLGKNHGLSFFVGMRIMTGIAGKGITHGKTLTLFQQAILITVHINAGKSLHAACIPGKIPGQALTCCKAERMLRFLQNAPMAQCANINQLPAVKLCSIDD